MTHHADSNNEANSGGGDFVDAHLINPRQRRIIGGSVLTVGLAAIALTIVVSAESTVDASTVSRQRTLDAPVASILETPRTLPESVDSARALAATGGVSHAIYNATNDELRRPAILLLNDAKRQTSDEVVWLTGRVRPLSE